MHFRFHANFYKLPDRLVAGKSLRLREIEVAPLREPDGRPPTFDEPFEMTFEQTMEGLLRLPRLDAEPDGFFVFTGGVGATRWQLDGHLFDFGGLLHRVELHGDCPTDVLDSLLPCIRAPGLPLAFELVQEGIALDEPAFRRWAAAHEPIG